MTKGIQSNRTSLLIFAAAAAILLAALAYRFAGTAADVSGAAVAGPGAATGDQIAVLEAATRQSPDSADAWQALGGGKFDLGDFAGAATAYERAVALNPKAAPLWSALGEARVMASARDPLPAAALDAFKRAAAIDPNDPRTRYFLAVKRDLDGDHQGAIDAWLALLADTPVGAPWEADLRRTIEQVGDIHKITVAPRLAATQQSPLKPSELPVAARAIPGPTKADMTAAAQLPKGQQDAMIDAMVGGLESKLKTNPANVDGWIMLMRSRMTLGESAKAGRALQDAIRANPAATARLRAQAELLGVPGG